MWRGIKKADEGKLKKQKARSPLPMLNGLHADSLVAKRLSISVLEAFALHENHVLLWECALVDQAAQDRATEVAINLAKARAEAEAQANAGTKKKW